jgi:hypothetical protein
LSQFIYYIYEYFKNQIYHNKFDFKTIIKDQVRSPYVRSIFIIGLFYLAWVPIIYTQTFKVSGDFWIPKPDLVKFGWLYAVYIKGFDLFNGNIIVIVFALALLVLRGFKKNRDEIFYFWLFLIPAIIFIISQFSNSLFLERYLIVCAPAMPILLATQKEKDFITNLLLRKKIGKRIFSKIQFSSILLLTIIVVLISRDFYRFNHPQKKPMRELTNYLKENYPNEEVINYYNDRLHYFELKYYGISTKIYSNVPIPFWNGTIMVDKNDVLSKTPNKNYLLVVASENIDDINIPDYIQVNKMPFNDLYILWYQKIK